MHMKVSEGFKSKVEGRKTHCQLNVLDSISYKVFLHQFEESCP